MNTDHQMAVAKRNIENAMRIIEGLNEQLKKAEEELKRMDTELPHKVIAEMLGVDGSTVYRMRERGELKSYRMEDVLTYMRNN